MKKSNNIFTFTGSIIPMTERKYLFLSLLLLAVMNSCIPILEPVVLKALFRVIEVGDFSEVLTCCLITAAIVLFLIIVVYITLVYADLWASKVIYKGIGVTFSKLHSANYYDLRTKYSNGDMLNCINNGCSSTIVVWAMITNLFANIISILILGAVSVTITYYLLFLIGVVAFIDMLRSWLESKKYRSYESRLQTLYGRSETDIHTLVYQIEFLNMVGMRDYMECNYRQIREETWKINFSKALVTLFWDVANGILSLAFKVAAVLVTFYKSVVSMSNIGSLFVVFDNMRSQIGKVRGQIVDISTKFVPIRKYEELIGISQSDREYGQADCSKPLIQFDSVDLVLNQKDILKDISLKINQGEKVLLVGKNGCGKSTLIKLMLGLYEPTAGRVQIQGLCSSELSYEQRRKYISYIPSTEQIFSDTIVHNVLMGAEPAEDDNAELILKDLFVKDCDELVADKSATEMSGGQKQRVGIARGLIHGAEIVFADEPTASLDNLNGEKAMNMIVENASTLIAVTHNPQYVCLFDRVLVLSDGHIVADANPIDIQKNPFYKEWAGEQMAQA